MPSIRSRPRLVARPHRREAARRGVAASLLAVLAGLAVAGLGGCTAQAQPSAIGVRPVPVEPSVAPPAAPPVAVDATAESDALRVDPLDARRADRITGGVDAPMLQAIARLGYARWLDAQLHPAPEALPPAVAARIAGFDIVRRPLAERVRESVALRCAFRGMPGDDTPAAQAARKAYHQGLAH